MESSNPDLPGMAPAEELQRLERTAIDPTIAALPVPNWVWPLVAILGSLYALGFALGGNWRNVFAAVFVFGLIFTSSNLAKRHGVVPSFRTQPRRLTLLRLRWLAESIVLAAAMALVGIYVNKWLAVALSGPLFAVISYLHDQRAENATAEMRASRV